MTAFDGPGVLKVNASSNHSSVQSYTANIYTFGTTSLTPEGRNEVRAVYGGFGLAVAGLLYMALSTPALRPGAFVAVAASLAGMAGGRVVAALIERPKRFYPSWFFGLLETSMALVLWLAA